MRQVVSKVLEKAMNERLGSSKRSEKAEASSLLEKVVNEMKSRVSARMHKETQRRKTALESSSLPTKLLDCRSKEVGRSEMFIVEGDSALGTARLARSSEFQALLPIRGKILNVQKASVSDMLSNAECAAMIQVIGAGSGRSFDIEQARYGKIILMTDADVDGAHIRTLLLTLFYRYMRPMIEHGRVYAAVPRCTASRSSTPDPSRTKWCTPIPKPRCSACWPRSKPRGGATRNRSSAIRAWVRWMRTSWPKPPWILRHRMLRRVNIEHAQQAEEIFDLLMGSDVAPRKSFIIAGAEDLERERIDV